jgi:thioredoxin reductase (NADPH)
MEKQNRQTVGTRPLIATQALIIGAGPIGLYQAFQLGLLGYDCQVVDVLPHIGGQCVELYPDKPIYDIPGLPRCTGLELIERLQTQIRPFEVPFHLRQQVASLAACAQGGYTAHTHLGQAFHAQAVFIAAGVGAFVARSWNVEGLAGLVGVGHAGDTLSSPTPLPHVLVAGGDESIMPVLREWLTRPHASLTLVHRRDKLDLPYGDQVWLGAMIHGQQIRFVAAQPLSCLSHQGRVQSIDLVPTEGDAFTLPCDVLVQCLGLSPKLGPIADWGLDLARRQIQVNPQDFGTSLPDVYAVGDVNHYPGKRKLIACGFHEATLAAYGFAQRQQGGPVTLEYTTASARLHARLKV